jgi:Subtilase family
MEMEKKWVCISLGILIGILILVPSVSAATPDLSSRREFRDRESGARPDAMERGVQNAVAVKGQLSAAEEKISSDLLQLTGYGSLVPDTDAAIQGGMKSSRQFVPAGEALPYGQGKGSDEDLVYVYISLQPDQDTAVVDPLCWKVTDRDEEHSIAVAWVGVPQLISLAEMDEVRGIQTVYPPVTSTGSVTTEGDSIHRSDQIRALYGYLGSGMKVGIISDGVDSWTDARATGDLPADLGVLSNTVGGDEGTAMLEIVHDIAPDAALAFHDCGANTVAFNSAIDDLVAAGCNIICDDISWISQPFFEDGTVASHVNDVISTHNLVYVTSAGNSAAKHYQGTYYDNSVYPGYHDFSGGSSAFKDLYIDIPPGAEVTVILQWNDRWGASSNDYDLYLYDESTDSLVAGSASTQSGSQDPLEGFTFTNSGSSVVIGDIWVTRYSAPTPRILEVFLYPSGGVTVYPNNLGSADSIFGHAAVPGAVTVGAIDALDPGNDDIESYSSRGPVTISYLSPGSRQKPDICGIDNVRVTGAGVFPSRFPGTSASAPHIAGILAQVWGAKPAMTATQVTSLLSDSAIDLGSPGFDTTFGYGRADALDSMNPTPVIDDLAPHNVTAKGKAFLLNVTGSSFLANSKVQWNGLDRTTTYVSSTHLKASILASDIATAGIAAVSVFTPAPGGGSTGTLTFNITPTGNPAPVLSSISPAFTAIGGPGFNLTVAGSNFMAGSTVRWNGEDRTTYYISASRLNATIPASDIDTAGSVPVTVFNPAPGGGSSTARFFNVRNPAPVLTGISPTSAIAGDPAFILTATGSNFLTGSQIMWNGANRDTTYVSATELTALITATDITTPATVTVQVFNPTPGGGTSAAQTFVIGVPNPVPVLTGISPVTATAGDPEFTLTITGSSFLPGSSVRWKGADRATTYGSGTQLTATIPASDIAAQGTAAVTVFNPAPGGGTSAAQTFTINPPPNPVPVLAAILPAAAVAGDPEFNLTVTGSSFTTGSIVQWKGLNRPTTYLSATRLNATIPASDIAVKGSAAVRVFTPAPGGGISGSRIFSITAPPNPVPVLTSLSPSVATEGGPLFTMTVNGSGFVIGSKVRWNGADRATTRVSETQLRATILAADIASPGNSTVRVFSPAPGGGNSSTLNFSVKIRPRISSFSPASADSGGPLFILMVTGSGYISGATVRWNGADRTTTFVSGTTLTASIPASSIADPGMTLVTVVNPDGGASDPVIFTTSSPFPVITGFDPSSTRAGGAEFTLTVDGTGFVPGSVVRWNTVDHTTTYVSHTRLTAVIPATDIGTTGTNSIVVSNPTPAGAISNTVTFAVNSALGVPPTLPS